MLRRRPIRDIYYALKSITKPTLERIVQLLLPSRLSPVALPSCFKVWNGKAEPNSGKPEGLTSSPSANEVEELPSDKMDIQRLQRYLGLLPLSHQSSWQKLESAENVMKLDPVFIAIDLEAFECNRNTVTEIGVSILDTRDINNIQCGIDGVNWLAKICTRHFIIYEYRKLVNKKFVKGCPDKFNFGRSEWLSLHLVPSVMQTVFCVLDPPHFMRLRNIVLVGHDVAGDVGYLKLLGYSPHSSGAIFDMLDTQRISSSKSQPWGLQKLCERLGIQPLNLHNAGNDAAYTMQVLVIMALRHAAGELELPIPRPPNPARIMKTEPVPRLQEPQTSADKQGPGDIKADFHTQQTASVATTAKDEHREALATTSEKHEKHLVRAERPGTAQETPDGTVTSDNASPMARPVIAAERTPDVKSRKRPEPPRRSMPLRRSARIRKLAARSLQVVTDTAPRAQAPK